MVPPVWLISKTLLSLPAVGVKTKVPAPNLVSSIWTLMGLPVKVWVSPEPTLLVRLGRVTPLESTTTLALPLKVTVSPALKEVTAFESSNQTASAALVLQEAPEAPFQVRFFGI